MGRGGGKGGRERGRWGGGVRKVKTGQGGSYLGLGKREEA